ncbi:MULTISPECIES: class I SAM-dependent methyltransferase [Spirulina sp. CCY15215]|uniref:class I SAM-dependent methyltransferase n=1 Tax=Spirulina sp. CCY15215 TaxID=2767591 RepID=UPI00194F9B8F|nr:class I SAM-dependent methyltransferase [Spirulina major]
MFQYSYEESVQWFRVQPEHTELVKFSYLDEDNLAAAQRFSESEEFQATIELLDIENKGQVLKILDLGCGNGIASYAFASLGHEITAIDPDPSFDVGLGATNRLASEVEIGKITTQQAGAESLPFADATFDIVYARQALHHFSDLTKGLQEAARVLKTGGFFLATREHVVSNMQQRKDFLSNHVLHRLHGQENAYLVEDYLGALQISGLKISRIFGHFDTVINHYPTTNAEIKDWLYSGFSKYLGKSLASILSQISFLEIAYRRRLSGSCDFPGRLYSFLCTKPQ